MGFNTGNVGEMWVLTRERLGQVQENLQIELGGRIACKKVLNDLKPHSMYKLCGSTC